MSEKKTIVVGIPGHIGSGKTTLAEKLANHANSKGLKAAAFFEKKPSEIPQFDEYLSIINAVEPVPDPGKRVLTVQLEFLEHSGAQSQEIVELGASGEYDIPFWEGMPFGHAVHFDRQEAEGRIDQLDTAEYYQVLQSIFAEVVWPDIFLVPILTEINLIKERIGIRAEAAEAEGDGARSKERDALDMNLREQVRRWLEMVSRQQAVPDNLLERGVTERSNGVPMLPLNSVELDFRDETDVASIFRQLMNALGAGVVA